MIVDTFSKNPDAETFRKLKALPKGNALPQSDTPSSSKPRNTQYELFVAALFKRAADSGVDACKGLLVELHEPPDILCTLDEVKFTIATKRLSSLDQFADHIRDATNQIRRANLPGIIALNYEIAENQENDPLLLSSNPEELKHASNATFNSFLERHRRELKTHEQLVIGGILTFGAWAVSRGKTDDEVVISTGWNLPLFHYNHARADHPIMQIVQSVSSNFPTITRLGVA